jgi:small subunit ribosomal protein S2
MGNKKSETKQEVIEELKESGVSEEIAEAEEKLDEKAVKEADSEKIQVSSSLKQRAETESRDDGPEAKTLEEKKKKLLEKVEKLKGKVDKTETEELKEQVKAKKREDMLIPLEEYVKAGIYLGTRVVTPDMRPFVYRRRADGLAIFNTDLIDEKLKEGVAYLSKFDSNDVILICKRQAGWKAVKMFSELTGIRVFTKKYPAGILTNTTLPDFFESELTIITDHWLDKNALHDTLKVRKNVLMVCDTNNFSKGANQIIIGNNKSAKSLGVIFYLLTRGYCKAKEIKVNIPDLEYWTGERE